MIDENKLIEDLNSLNAVNEHESHLIDEVFDIVNRQPKVGEWISVKDKLPKVFELVLIQNIYGLMSVALRIENSWFNFQGNELCTAIAWMPLPEPYKGDE